MGDLSLWMRKSGAETWSARMKRILGFLSSVHSGGGEEVEEAADCGGLLRLYMQMEYRIGKRLGRYLDRISEEGGRLKFLLED